MRRARSRHSDSAITTTLLLLVLLLAWRATSAASAFDWVWTALLAAPAALVLTSLLRHRPAAPAWTILGAIPYVVFGVMELIANPAARSWALACAVLGFCQFVVLAGLLRTQER